MKVLLVSPVRTHDVLCGDVIYTELLENYPPENVEYINYIDAQKNKTLLERRRLRNIPNIFKDNYVSGIIDIPWAISMYLMNFFRRSNYFIPSPWHYFELKDSYDLIHCHVFPTMFLEKKAPVIVSNAARVDFYMKNALGISQGKVDRIMRREKILLDIFGMQDSSLKLDKVDRLITFTNYLKQEYIKNDVSEEKISVVPIGVPEIKINKAKNKDFVLGFIAKDFMLKGGYVLLEAYKSILRRREDIRLIIVGCEPQMSKKEMENLNITWISLIPRKEILEKYLPQFDIFVYPSYCDGFPLVLLEVLSAGIPLIVSDTYTLPEIIGYGEAGLIAKSGDAKEFEKAIISLLNKKKLSELSNRVKNFFMNNYEVSIVNKRLKQVYKRTIDEWEKKQKKS